MPKKVRPEVQISTLGKRGRFGNQLFQYAFARSYAERVGAVLQTPPWIGQKLFVGINDPPITEHFPRLRDEQHPRGKLYIDIYGHFVESLGKHYSADEARSYFRFKPEILKSHPSRQDKYVAAHLRRGDIARHPDNHWLIPQSSYEAAMLLVGIDPLKVVWVSDAFGRPMIEDFLTLMYADTLFIANSTFSYWAGILGNNRKIYSPVPPPMRKGYTHCKFKEGCFTLPCNHDTQK